MADKLVRHSATSLEKYQNCSLLWFHRYVDHWKEPTDEGAAFGLVLHAAVADALLDGSGETEQSWYELYKKEGVLAPSHELVMLTEDYFENWQIHHTFDGTRPILVEEMYEKEVEGYGLLAGKIDALWWNEEYGFYIVDHKFMKSPEKKKSNQQMAVYSLLEPRATHFFYEKVGRDDYEMQETHNLAPALQKIAKTIECIRKEEFNANPQRWFIPYCPFIKECGKCSTQ